MRPSLLVQFCVCMLCAAVCAQAQVYPDSKGRDFWLTFPPNFHNNEDSLGFSPLDRLEHQLYIYVGSETPTTGTITIRNITGTSTTIPFSITNPAVLFEYRTYYDGIELRGFNRGGSLMPQNSQAESPAPQSIHIQSASDVTVYAMNQARTTSDALLVLPTDALTGDYVVMSYNSDIRSFSDPSASTPSQFVVVATEDNTRVEITPTANTSLYLRGDVIVETLQQGESFLVQAAMDGPDNADLSGSVVRANKPVAVFGSHQRATIPIAFIGQLASRDYLIEQMSPVGTWGKSAFVTPFAKSSNEIDLGTDLYRVVAAFDSTAVIVDGAFQVLMNAGQVFESSLTRASAITTSRPALVAQFKKTTGQTGQPNQRIGDPLMMLVPPAEQFMNEYRFINVQSYEFAALNDSTPIYEEQFLNIVVPTLGIPGLVLDGLPVSPGMFQPIGQTPFSWTQLSMTDGVHHIKGDTTFGIYVYGYGIANSYGYIGGMAFRPLDTYPPVILSDVRCGSVSGTIADSVLGDSRVSDITVVPGSEQNVQLVLGAFQAPQAVVQFQASLVNPFDDGSIAVDATDVVGQTTRKTIVVAGFTIGVRGRGADATPDNHTVILPVGKERCDSVQLENYGKYPHTLTTVRFSSGAQVASIVPMTLAPGEQRWVHYCRQFDAEGITNDTLIIGDSCRERNSVAVAFEAQLDKRPPTVQTSVDPCSTSVEINISDITDIDFGLESARILESVMVNCVATPSAGEPATIIGHTVKWTISVIDPYEDAIYGYEAIDSAGNIATSIDTIPGFTLEIAGVKGDFRAMNMQPYTVGLLGCELITLRNYGAFGITVPSIAFQKNVLFSAPQHQFPMYIAPGSSQSVEICFSPIEADTAFRSDTLFFLFGCTRSRLAVVSEGQLLAFDGITRCEVPVGTDISRIAPSGLLAAPLPAFSVLTLVLATAVDDAVIRFLDLTGSEVHRVSWQGAPTKGLAVSVQDLPEGNYICIVESKGTVRSAPCVVHR